MTIALCFNCGETKHGAICPCSKCQVSTTGNMELDIQFSDHHYSENTLRQLGAVIKEIRAHCDDGKICFWAFMYYVTNTHSGMGKVKLRPDAQDEVDAVLAECTLPDVVVEKSSFGR